jgi:hypothetical protein
MVNKGLLGTGMEIFGGAIMVLAPELRSIAWILLILGGLLIVVGIWGWLKEENCPVKIIYRRVVLWLHKRRRKQLYIGQMSINFDRLDNHSCLEINIKGFNGSMNPIFISGIEGYILLSYVGADGKSATHPLQLPAILTLQADREVPRYSEINLTIEQRVDDGVAKTVSAMISSGKQVSFDFRVLKIYASHKRKSVMLPLFDGINCSISSEKVHCARVAFMSVNMRGEGNVAG